ncbi:hypothetical protein EV182_001918 [Spiromyces aspiralis]|uniref:Uncharacterized protein n=1 Tax=Spiromyces aspiralis TaxID=68401 RepID=A0ACC1HTD4_9FUNG|nr:hypothetical protein EV182_001918 [Spiromyces aspiralis]
MTSLLREINANELDAMNETMREVERKFALILKETEEVTRLISSRDLDPKVIVPKVVQAVNSMTGRITNSTIGDYCMTICTVVDLCRRRGFDRSEVTRGILDTLLHRVGQLPPELDRNQFAPPLERIATWIGRSGDIEALFELVGRCTEVGVSPTMQMVSALALGYVRQGQVDDGLRLLDIATKHGLKMSRRFGEDLLVQYRRQRRRQHRRQIPAVASDSDRQRSELAAIMERFGIRLRRACKPRERSESGTAKFASTPLAMCHLLSLIDHIDEAEVVWHLLIRRKGSQDRPAISNRQVQIAFLGCLNRALGGSVSTAAAATGVGDSHSGGQDVRRRVWRLAADYVSCMNRLDEQRFFKSIWRVDLDNDYELGMRLVAAAARSSPDGLIPLQWVLRSGDCALDAGRVLLDRAARYLATLLIMVRRLERDLSTYRKERAGLVPVSRTLQRRSVLAGMQNIVQQRIVMVWTKLALPLCQAIRSWHLDAAYDEKGERERIGRSFISDKSMLSMLGCLRGLSYTLIRCQATEEVLSMIAEIRGLCEFGPSDGYQRQYRLLVSGLTRAAVGSPGLFIDVAKAIDIAGAADHQPLSGGNRSCPAIVKLVDAIATWPQWKQYQRFVFRWATDAATDRTSPASARTEVDWVGLEASLARMARRSLGVSRCRQLGPATSTATRADGQRHHHRIHAIGLVGAASSTPADAVVAASPLPLPYEPTSEEREMIAQWAKMVCLVLQQISK